MRHQIIFGTSVINNEPPTVKDPTVFFPGRAMTGQSGFQINDDIMSKHILLLGGSGCGKTNSFCYTVKALRESMNGEDTVLESFPPGTFDAVITDPPYASGGRTQAEKSKATAKKYSSMGGNAPPDFDGDAKDQRSWIRWAAEWLYLARRAAKPGAPVCMFIDWRQLPCASDALQWAGWIWRGIAVWDKGNSRPQKGRFRQQAEYIVWGSNGDMPVSRPVPCLPGVFKYGNPQNRIHLTEKPLQLMQDLVKITEPGGHILDPFAGSGTTVLAAVKEGYDATGIEVTDVYADLARKRLETELNAA